ncbi:hypothetical protein [uncultured Methanobrevibacter sp.]|uniref:hypothetical protein n=1 Tax=uncultured Methanobrevibacter sp. TaxID=253161 RepID=UPI0025DF0647|nr:hypothetical protein [uncultured Methanobrevibacter sp.]
MPDNHYNGFIASSTKQRYDEILNNPLVFCKFGQTNIQDDIGFSHNVEGWSSCDSTISFHANEKDLPPDDKRRRLFVVGKPILSNGEVDQKKEDQDIVNFEITEFDTNKVSNWILVFKDCIYNYRSGNSRHCHMTLFWALYITSWQKDTIKEALTNTSNEDLQIVCSYISANIFAFSVDSQYKLIEILKAYNPNLKLVGIPDVESALKELSPSGDFTTFGFYQKIDYILAYGKNQQELEHLKKLYTTSRNGLIYFKYWMSHAGNKFYNYNYLEVIYTYVDCFTQLSIVKRYLHDIRLNLIAPDFNLIENLRDIIYQAYVDIRYFISTPGDNIDLVAPMFCDTLLTLKKTDGAKIQSFNGILDFAVGHSNKAYPNIDLGVRYFLPSCDGGLMHNSSFYGFIHYAEIYTFDDSKLTEDNLKHTADFLINKYATRQYHDICKGNNIELTESEIQNCKKIISSFINKQENGKFVKQIVKSACPDILHEPIKPYVWKRTPGSSDSILSLFIEDIESKEFLRYEDISLERLKKSLEKWGRKYQSFSFMNGYPPEYLQKKEVAYHIVASYYSPTSMEIYPNNGMFYSSKISLLGVWNANEIAPNQNPAEIAARAESSIVYSNTFDSLKKMFPNAELGEDFIKLPYDNTELSKIKAYYYYRQHEFDPEKSYSKLQYWCREFLTPRKIQGVFYCTPIVANTREKVSNLPFFWCRSNECFCNVLGRQTLEKEKDWRQYTLYHAAEILGYKLIDVTSEGNIPTEAVSNFAGEVVQAEKLYARLICRSCGHMIFSTRGSLLNGSRFFSCANSQCSQYRKEIYLSRCNNCKKGLIDSRDSKRCENNWVICPSCLACCNDNLFNLLIEKHRRNGRVPPKLKECEGKGHNDKNQFFCPKCGTQLENIVIEEKVRLDSGTEDIIQTEVFGCPQCRQSYERELKRFRESNK